MRSTTPIMDRKYCSGCCQCKPTKDFSYDKSTERFHARCKDCQAEAAQKRRAGLKTQRICGRCRQPVEVESTSDLCDDCRMKRRAYHKRYWKRAGPRRQEARRANRIEVYTAYGGCKCACCGETEMEFLTIDHINGTTPEERRYRSVHRSGGDLVEKLKREGFPPGFRVLCFNCNWASRLGRVCPHQAAKRLKEATSG